MKPSWTCRDKEEWPYRQSKALCVCPLPLLIRYFMTLGLHFVGCVMALHNILRLLKNNRKLGKEYGIKRLWVFQGPFLTLVDRG
jgi:hypothetical protein